MTKDRIRSLGARIACAAFLSLSVGAHAAPADFDGRGVFRFASQSGCPLGASEQADADCNRVALDVSDAHAVVDPASHTIAFSSDAAHADKTVIGDVLLQGSGVAEDGRRVPVSLQVLLRRSGGRWLPDMYVHAPVRGKFTDVTIDPYRVVVREDAAEHVILTPERAREIVSRPSLAARLASVFVGVRPTDDAHPSADDITIAVGMGHLSKSVLRARLATTDAQPADPNRALASGNWSIELDALSDHIPRWVVQRELFLFGLDASPLLKDVGERGLREHDRLVIGQQNGSGYLRYNGATEAFDGASATARAFLQESFIGLILVGQAGGDARSAAHVAHVARRPNEVPA